MHHNQFMCSFIQQILSIHPSIHRLVTHFLLLSTLPMIDIYSLYYSLKKHRVPYYQTEHQGTQNASILAATKVSRYRMVARTFSYQGPFLLNPFLALVLGAGIISTFNALKCFFLKNHTGRADSGWFLVKPLQAYSLIPPVQGFGFHQAHCSAFQMHPLYGSLFCWSSADLHFYWKPDTDIAKIIWLIFRINTLCRLPNVSQQNHLAARC